MLLKKVEEMWLFRHAAEDEASFMLRFSCLGPNPCLGVKT